LRPCWLIVVYTLLCCMSYCTRSISKSVM
jgi:hypothetical protein